jgi:hypothetical protein
MHIPMCKAYMELYIHIDFKRSRQGYMIKSLHLNKAIAMIRVNFFVTWSTPSQYQSWPFVAMMHIQS